MMKMESDSEEISAKKQHWGILQNEVYSSKYMCVSVCVCVGVSFKLYLV